VLIVDQEALLATAGASYGVPEAELARLMAEYRLERANGDATSEEAPSPL